MVSLNNGINNLLSSEFNCFLFCLATVGRVGWFNNWVAFMDNMLQIQILKEDTRSLYVPTSLQKLLINVKKHSSILQTLSKEKPGN